MANCYNKILRSCYYSISLFKSNKDQEEKKLQLLSEQNRLADRGAAEMVLLQLAASRGTS